MEGIFKAEDIKNLYDRGVAQKQLEALGNFWIGRDVSLENKINIPPLGLVRNVPIVVNKLDFPEIKITKGALGELNWSVRSSLSQSGIEIRFHKSYLTAEMIRDINDGLVKVTIPVDIQNHVNRPIELEGNVMRFFWVNDHKRLRQEKLRQALKSDLIVEGEEGKDWSFGDVDLEDEGTLAVKVAEGIDPKELKDVCIRLPLKEKFYIPKSNESFSVKSKKDLPFILKEIPEGSKELFKIGETAKVKLSKNIIAVINTGIYERDKRHVHSPLIDSGFEGNIRTETIRDLDYVEIFLYRK
ncbi:MAG TPA: hypothetical protein VK675_04850 [Candidatus Paceibacterota bacterium]|nr:hypothetical protein [Candidatus Paceibacterota bacterium]